MREFNYAGVSAKLLTPEIINLVSAIHEFRGKQSQFVGKSPQVLNRLVDIAKIQSTGASNRIEGIVTTEKRLKELVAQKAQPRNRSEQEIAGYREVLNTIHDNYEHIPLSPSVILQLHRDLYKYSGSDIGGRWKNTDNVIEEVDADGNRRIRFVPVPAFEVPNTILNLCEAFTKAINEGIIDPLLLIAMFILDFLCIHPFNDGNGRISRLLTLLLLYHCNYVVGKYISLEMLIEKTKEAYYDVLQDSSANWHEGNNDYVPFVQYLLGIIKNAYQQFDDRISLVDHKRVTAYEKVLDKFRNSLGKLTKGELLELIPHISISTLEVTLNKLRKEDKIKKIGNGRYVSYIYNRSKINE